MCPINSTICNKSNGKQECFVLIFKKKPIDGSLGNGHQAKQGEQLQASLIKTRKYMCGFHQPLLSIPEVDWSRSYMNIRLILLPIFPLVLYICKILYCDLSLFARLFLSNCVCVCVVWPSALNVFPIKYFLFQKKTPTYYHIKDTNFLEL